MNNRCEPSFWNEFKKGAMTATVLTGVIPLICLPLDLKLFRSQTLHSNYVPPTANAPKLGLFSSSFLLQVSRNYVRAATQSFFKNVTTSTRTPVKEYLGEKSNEVGEPGLSANFMVYGLTSAVSATLDSMLGTLIYNQRILAMKALAASIDAGNADKNAGNEPQFSREQLKKLAFKGFSLQMSKNFTTALTCMYAINFREPIQSFFPADQYGPHVSKIGAGMLGGMACTIATQPMEIINKNYILATNPQTLQSPSLLAVAHDIVKEKGYTGLFTNGLKVNMLRNAAIFTTIHYVTEHFMRDKLEIDSTTDTTSNDLPTRASSSSSTLFGKSAPVTHKPAELKLETPKPKVKP